MTSSAKKAKSHGAKHRTASAAKQARLRLSTMSLAVILAAVVSATLSRPARADWLQTYVATQCDAASGTGIVWFGYADEDAPPKFVALDPSIDGGVSKHHVIDYDKTDAKCSFPNGREIRVRYVSGQHDGDTLGRYSIWVDKIRILSGNAAGGRHLPAAVVVSRGTYRKCNFRLSGEGDVYALTATPLPHSKEVAIDCDSRAERIGGTRDLVEYPLQAPRNELPVGTLFVRMATPGAPCDSFLDDGALIEAQVPWGDLRYIQWEGRPAWNVRTTKVDLLNSAAAQVVYKVGSGGTFQSSFLLVPPASVRYDDVIMTFQGAADFGQLPSIARDKGWAVVGWGLTQYQYPYDVGVVSRGRGTYVIATPEANDNLAAVVLQAAPNGTAKGICELDTVRPHL